MANNLFIIFTRKDNAPREVRTLLGNNISNERIIGIDKQIVKRGWEQINNEFNPDVLIILDSFDLSDDNILGVLESMIKSKTNVYIIFHITTPAATLVEQKAILGKFCIDNKIILFETSEHHNEGNPGADALNKIARMINNNSFESAEYNKVLDELLTKPHYIDPKLEAKLELLHQLLIPSADFSKYENNNGLWTKLINLVDNTKSEKLKSAWETFKDGCNGGTLSNGSFGSNYITILSNLRDALLKEV